MKKSIWIFNIILSVIAFAFILYWVADIILTSQLRGTVSRYTRDGQPMTVAGILPKAVPDKKNAASDYLFAAALLSRDPDYTAKIRDFNREYILGGDKEQQELERVFSSPETAQIISVLSSAAAKPYLLFELDYGKGFSIQLQHLEYFELFTDILCAKADFEAAKGRVKQAYDLLLTALKVNSHLEKEPLLATQITRMRCLKKIVACLFPKLEISGISDKTAYEFIELFRAVDNKNSLAGAFDTERIFISMVFSDHAAGKIDITDAVAGSDINEFVYSALPVYKKDYRLFLEQFLRYKDYFSGTVGESVPMPADVPSYCLVSKAVLDDYTESLQLQKLCDNLLNSAVITLALNIYKNHEGKYPGKLDQLKPVVLKDIPLNPFSGKQYSYDGSGKLDGTVSVE